MLVNTVVVLVVRAGHLVGILSLLKVALELVQNSNLQLGINATLHGEVTRDNRVLEVANGLVKLVGLGQNHA